MTRDDIINMAAQAGVDEETLFYNGDAIERFYAIATAEKDAEIERLRMITSHGDAAAFEEYVGHQVETAVAKEREACAVVCEKLRDSFLSTRYATGQPASSLRERFAAGQCAALIRERVF